MIAIKMNIEHEASEKCFAELADSLCDFHHFPAIGR